MRRFFGALLALALLAALLLSVLPACAPQGARQGNGGEEGQEQQQEEGQGEEPGGTAVKEIEVVIGERAFSATLEEGEAAQAFARMLPLTLRMEELNGNEKYFYLEERLPSAALRPGRIEAGDIMLYGASCIVLFYESFSTGYSYTPLGRLADAAGLAEAVGEGSVSVTFRAL